MQRRLFSAVVYKGQIAYIATCPELGVTSQGKTEEDALKNLEEAVELYLEDEDVQQLLKKQSLNPPHLTTISVPFPA